MKIIILVQNHFEFDLFRLNRGLIIVDLLLHHPTHLFKLPVPVDESHHEEWPPEDEVGHSDHQEHLEEQEEQLESNP